MCEKLPDRPQPISVQRLDRQSLDATTLLKLHATKSSRIYIIELTRALSPTDRK